MNSSDKTCKKGLKQKKWISPSNFNFNKQSWFFRTNFPKKDFFKRLLLIKNKKNKHNHWILLTQISLCTKFHLKPTVLIFLTKFPQKGYFLSKTGNQHHWILDFRINYSRYQISASTGNFDFLDQICPKRVLPTENRKCEHHHWLLDIRE